MRVFKKWIFRAIKLYALVVVAGFVFGLATLAVPALERLERRISPANFAVALGGSYYPNFEEFLAAIPGSEKQLSSVQPVAFEDIEIWIVVLDSPEDSESIAFASRLGIQIQEIASWDKGSVSRIASYTVAIRLRWSFFPIYVQKKQVVVLNGEGLFQTYRQDCINRILYNAMIKLNDAEFLEGCKVAPAE